MMKQGYYKVTYTARGTALTDTGVFRFKDGLIMGGDISYLMEGTYEDAGDNFTAAVKVRKHSQGTSMFGQLDSFQLIVQGAPVAGKEAFQAEAKLANDPSRSIILTGNWIFETLI